MIYRGVGKNQSGFTLIELIVVIVVIGILATIATVSYNGIQQRAQNVALSTAANNTVKGLQLYYAQNGRYPVPTEASPPPTICLGTAASLPAQDDFEAGQCYDGPSSSIAASGKLFTSASFDSQLSEAIDSSPVANISYKGPTTWSSGDVSVRGLMYQASGLGVTADGSAAILIFFLKGSGQSCNIGVSGFAFTVNPSGPITGATQCYYILDGGS